MWFALRTLAGLLIGMFAAILLIVAMEFFSSVVHPVPEGFGETTEEMCLHVERYPDWVLAVGVVAWGGAAFVGAWIAQRIGNVWSFAIVGALLLAALAFNVAQLPYAMWFKIVVLLVIPSAILLGRRLAVSRNAAKIAAN